MPSTPAALKENAPSSGLRLSLRLKLTLWMVLLFLAVQLSLVLVLQVYQHRSIDNFFNDRLISRWDQVAAELRPHLPGITDELVRDRAEEYRRLLLQRQLILQVFDEHGNPIAASRTPRSPLPPLVWEQIAHAQQPEAVKVPVTMLHDEEANSVRAGAGWTVGPDGKRYLILLAWSDIYAQEVFRLLLGVVFFSIPIGLIAMVVSAYAISGVAVQPIRAMRQMAKGFEPEHLSEKLPGRSIGSEMESLRRDLDRTRMRLDAAFTAQERFMSNVSHELKTPIAVLMTEAQTLKLDSAGKDVRAFVSSTMDELDKLGRMVDSFLLLTRVRHGKATIPNQELCLARDIIAQSYEGCAPMAAQYGVRLSARLPEDDHLDAGVFGNCDLLRTILDNLIRNAIRFSPKGHVVEIDGHIEDERLVIRVRDTGPGIPAEVLPRIFDRFSQSSEEQRRGRGHGLGLEIAMGITELHGGVITAANRPDGGCEFTVSLPVAGVPGTSAKPAAAT